MDRNDGQRKEFHQKLFKTPKEIALAVIIVARKKAELRLDVLAVMALYCGAWIAFGGFASVSISGGVPLAEPGLRRLLAGLTFSMGLMIVFGVGGELFTGNAAVFSLGILARKVGEMLREGYRSSAFLRSVPSQVTLFAAARNLLISWIFNFVGALAVAYFLAFLTGSMDSEPWNSYIRTLALSKINVGWGAQLLRGVGANMLVVLACFISIGCEDVISKFFTSLMFISAMIFIGFEHSVANMFFLPLGLMCGAPSDVGQMFWRNLIPVTLGNMIGGFLVALFLWYAYISSAAANKVQKSWSNRILSRFVFGEPAQGTESLGKEWTTTRVVL